MVGPSRDAICTEASSITIGMTLRPLATRQGLVRTLPPLIRDFSICPEGHHPPPDPDRNQGRSGRRTRSFPASSSNTSSRESTDVRKRVASSAAWCSVWLSGSLGPAHEGGLESLRSVRSFCDIRLDLLAFEVATAIAGAASDLSRRGERVLKSFRVFEDP